MSGILVLFILFSWGERENEIGRAGIDRMKRLTIFLILVILLVGCGAAESQGVAPEALSHEVTFRDVAGEVGLDFRQGAFRWGTSGDPIAMMGGGLCWLDYDNDGWLDLYVINSYALEEAGRWQSEAGGLPTSALFRNEEGAFADVSTASGTDIPMRGNGCVAADLNQDGWTDIYVTTSRVNLLLWNEGDGTFSEGGAAAGVDAYGWQTAVSVADLNQDGLPDLFVAGYVDVNNRIEGSTMGFPNTNVGVRDLLFVSEGLDEAGRTTYREVGELVGLETADFEYGLGSLFSDVDGDGDVDLFVANDTNPNRLYINEPLADDAEGLGFRLVEQGSAAQVADTNSGMGVAGGDFDENGRFDLFITNMGEQLHSVYANDGGTFADATSTMGVADMGVGWTGWGTMWADFDLDTDLDLFVVNGAIPVTDLANDPMQAQLFINQTAQGAAGQFVEQSESAGLLDVGPILGRGGAAADYDNDGDVDVAINTIGGNLVLLENEGVRSNWLALEFGEEMAGGVVSAVLEDGRSLRREMHIGSSYLASEDPRCLLGLGAATEVAELRVTWPSGEESVLENVAANQLIVVP